jgi:hypothetical protein
VLGLAVALKRVGCAARKVRFATALRTEKRCDLGKLSGTRG